MRASWALAAGAVIVACGAQPARAAPSPDGNNDAAPRPHGSGITPAGKTETISVFGAGSTRQLTSIGRAQMRASVPGTSPLKVLNQLPGVNYQSADPFGAYEYSSSLYIRGFNQSQLGFTLDGIPLGDQQFNNYDGLSITRAISSDNILSANVFQGAGAIDVASTSNLGGAIEFHSVDPTTRPGGAVEQTFGSNNTFRTFVRLESGELNPTGTRFYVSYARTSLDLWKGSGTNYSDQVNAKLLQPFSDGSTVKVFFDWSAIRQFDYQDMSRNYLDTYGPNLANTYPNYTAAYLAAEHIYSPAIAATSDPLDAAYYAGTANREDFLSGLTWTKLIGDDLTWASTVYGHGDRGYSTWATPYTPSPNGAPLSERVQNPGIRRGGLLSAVTWDLGRNSFNSGVWYEYGQFTEARAFAEAPLLGQGTLGDPTDGYPSGIFAKPWSEVFNTNTFQFHLQDTYHVLPTLTLNAGFRSLLVHTANKVTEQDIAANGGPVAQGALTAADAFLPQISANWRFLPTEELFFDVSHNMRAFPEDGYDTNIAATPWTESQASFQATARDLQPETDWVYEGGWRTDGPRLDTLVSLYRVNFSNRLQLISTGPVIAPTTAVQNVGGVTSDGAEASFTWRFVPHWSIYNSLSWNRSTFNQDVMTSSGIEPIRGKTIPNYPEWMDKAALSFRYGSFSASLDGRYLSKRYISYLNDSGISGYAVLDLGTAYEFGKTGPFHNLRVAFNIYNLTNKTYVATMGELGNPFSGDYQTFLIGAPLQAFGTISTDF